MATLTAVPLGDLPPRPLKTYEAALAAAERKNYAYAVVLLRDVLRREPNCNEVRDKMRQFQLFNIGGKRNFGLDVAAFFVQVYFWVRIKAKQAAGEPVKALDEAEKAMSFNPCSPFMVSLVASAARAAELPAVEAETLQWGLRYNDRNVDFWKRLADASIAANNGQKAVECMNRLRALQPTRKEWEEGLRLAMAQAAMDRGHWTELEKGEGDFRQAIKDTDEAARLEQEGRTVNTAEGLQLMIQDQQQKCEEQPTVQNYRQLGDLYRRAKDFDSAIAAMEKSQEVSEAPDPTVDDTISELHIAKERHKLEEARAILDSEDASEEEKEQAQHQIAALEQVILDMRLEHVQQQVKRNPSSHEHRMRFGQLLLENGDYDQALEHLQYAQQSARYRIDASRYAGKAFFHKELYDLAIEQYQGALQDMRKMNDAKKECLYDLGKCYEAQGNAEKAKESFKAIYAVDIGYRDVRQLIEETYR